MSEQRSQSISSNRISESTIARMAGNMSAIGTDPKDVLRAGQHGIGPDDPIVRGTVALARAIAEEVRRTGPPDMAAHVLELDPSEAYKLGWHDGRADRDELRSGAPSVPDIAARVMEQGAARSASCERQARDLLLRLGVAGEWTSGDLVELANLFAEKERLEQARAADRLRMLSLPDTGEVLPGSALEAECERLVRGALGACADHVTAQGFVALVDIAKGAALAHRARAGDQMRLFHLEAALSERRRDEDGPAPDGMLTVPVEVCLGCNQQRRVRGDCGCPAGTGTRNVSAISEEEYRQKAKAVRAALLGPGVKDPGHPPTVEMAKALRDGYTRQLAEADRARALLSEVGDENTRLQRARIGDSETVGRLMSEVKALQDGATDREVRVLLRVATELENGLHSGSVRPSELVRNEIAWCRSQAKNLRPTEAALAIEREMFRGGTPGGGKTLRLTMDRTCPTCASHDPARHPSMQPDGGEVQVCRDAFHGGTVCPTCTAVQRHAPSSCRDPWHGVPS